MIPGGDRQRLTPLLLASLLMHLLLLLAMVVTGRREPADRRVAVEMTVEPVTVSGDNGGKPANPSQLPVRRPAVGGAAPQPAPLLPAGVLPPRPTPLPRAGNNTPVAATENLPAAMGQLASQSGGTSAGMVGAPGQAPVDGGGDPRARGGTAAPSGVPLLRRSSYEAQLKQLIESRKEYPFAARRGGWEGSCQRRFILGRNGELRQVDTLTSCGHTFLDAAATRAITAVGTFPPLPEEIGGSEAAFTITMTFTLAKR